MITNKDPKNKRSVKSARGARRSDGSGRRKKGKQPKRSLFGRLIKFAVVLGLWGILVGGAITVWLAAELPYITANVSFERKRSLTFLASDGTELTTVGELKGETIAVRDLPPHLIQALLAIEDRRFYGHFGIDPRGVARAMVVNIREGGFVQGGSTITQQLAKNLFLSPDRTLKRKVQEALLALWLEQQLTKDEILTAYFNRVYFGSGAYGIQAAADLYFDVDARNLTLSQSALLVGLLRAPSRLSPLNNPERAEARKRVVLQAMKDAGFLEQLNDSGLPTLTALPPIGSDGRQIRYVSDWLLDEISAKTGAIEADLIIDTTLHPELQDVAEQALKRIIDQYGAERSVSQGAVLVLRNDGQVKAMVGGVDYMQSQFNRATQALRPPGSAFKPFVFLTALNRGKRADDLILDAPITEGSYRPANFADEYYGDVSLEQALTLSMNTATVRLASEIGIGYVLGTARVFQIGSDLERNLSTALGSSAVSLYELTRAYLALANQGQMAQPYAILRIRDAEGNIYYEHRTEPSQQVSRPETVRAVNQMMQRVVSEGTGRGASLGDIPAAGKTGTSQGYRDAWFIGFTPLFTGGVWLGNDDNTPMARVTGGSFPTIIWREVMNAAHRLPEQSSTLPNTLGQEDDGGLGGLFQRLLGDQPAPAVSPPPSGQPSYNR